MMPVISLTAILLLMLWRTEQASSSLLNVTDLFESCDSQLLSPSMSPTDCGSNKICTVSNNNFNFTFEFTSNINSENSCQLFACQINDSTIQERSISCALYNLTDCSSKFCENTTNVSDEGGLSGTEATLLAFVIIFAVTLLVAGCVILTLALMVRDMRNERVQDDLPNPYSCLFSFMKSVFASSEEPDHTKPPKKAENKKKKKKTKDTQNAPKHHRRKEKVEEGSQGEEGSEDPQHEADDYEEMDAAAKRGSFLEGGPDDIYQNT